MIVASKIAAEASHLSASWGARCVCRWTMEWIKTRALPDSDRGCHSKIYSLLSDPTVREAIRTYLRSNKWSVDPPKLQKLFAKELSPAEAHEYAQRIVSQEMPRGLKSFVEDTLLPRMQCKPGRLGLSMSSMRPHDGEKKGWVLEGQQPLKKKGAGRGIHQSDFLCSTVGWLKDASVTLEYGKNHDGFWNGELFVKQLQEKFFPAFEAAHGPGYTAVILVDNSQGHSVYAPDALRVSEMGFRPGGKQARMRNGWYNHAGQRIEQPMIFPADHEKWANQPKGMQQVLIERGLWRSAVKKYLREHCDYTFNTLRENMPIALQSVSVELIRKWEHRAWRFIDAYTEGLDAQTASAKVKEFSSCRYTSHRRIPEDVAHEMDG
ncbi:hypothetical protein F5878DRAFT_549780 [Lentinula raphanica]|uniref:Uncharacterized protein n=1 Tax=Lentinula raphanica TaxID=153919 RepID=A0AA38U2L9_9AGAR|nr:hypothetical protein F5878DRAFT_549780 [Lentinula raphanica]